VTRVLEEITAGADLFLRFVVSMSLVGDLEARLGGVGSGAMCIGVLAGAIFGSEVPMTVPELILAAMLTPERLGVTLQNPQSQVKHIDLIDSPLMMT